MSGLPGLCPFFATQKSRKAKKMTTKLSEEEKSKKDFLKINNVKIF